MRNDYLSRPPLSVDGVKTCLAVRFIQCYTTPISFYFSKATDIATFRDRYSKPIWVVKLCFSLFRADCVTLKWTTPTTGLLKQRLRLVMFLIYLNM